MEIIFIEDFFWDIWNIVENWDVFDVIMCPIPQFIEVINIVL